METSTGVTSGVETSIGVISRVETSTGVTSGVETSTGVTSGVETSTGHIYIILYMYITCSSHSITELEAKPIVT